MLLLSVVRPLNSEIRFFIASSVFMRIPPKLYLNITNNVVANVYFAWMLHSPQRSLTQFSSARCVLLELTASQCPFFALATRVCMTLHSLKVQRHLKVVTSLLRLHTYLDLLQRLHLYQSHPHNLDT